MANITKDKCLVVADAAVSGQVRHWLGNHPLSLVQVSLSHLVSALHHHSAACIIVYLAPGHVELTKQQVMTCKSHFTAIPLILLVAEIEVETIRVCGKIGVDRVLAVADLALLREVVAEIIHQGNAQVCIADFGVKADAYSFILRKSLRYIEQHYLTLMNTSEVADFAGISECTLSREFRKYNLPGPKRLLMYCKIKHATQLMRNEELKIKQIAAMAGFTNAKRFHECFQMVFGCSPGEYRGRLPGPAEMERFWEMQGQPVAE